MRRVRSERISGFLKSQREPQIIHPRITWLDGCSGFPGREITSASVLPSVAYRGRIEDGAARYAYVQSLERSRRVTAPEGKNPAPGAGRGVAGAKKEESGEKACL